MTGPLDDPPSTYLYPTPQPANPGDRLDAQRLVRDVYSNPAVPPEVTESQKGGKGVSERDHYSFFFGDHPTMQRKQHIYI